MNWLHPNRDEAGEEYRRIHALLVGHFHKQGCSSPNKLADATMDRTGGTLTAEEIENWEGKKEKYCFRVAWYILLEDKAASFHETQIPEGLDVISPDDNEDKEVKFRCLDKCLEQLPEDKRDLINRYYKGKKATKIKNREELARELNLDLTALRVRAHRIREKLRICIERCLLEETQSLEA